MNFKTVIFDLDGTLLNTLDDLANSANFALSEFNFPQRTRDEVRQFVGNGVRLLIERAVPVGTTEHTVDECLEIFRDHYENHKNDNTKPYDGILHTLSKLKEAGVKMAVVSNKYDLAVKELCAPFFSSVIDVAIGERENVRRKPAPDSVFEALKTLGANKESAIYVGDSDVDVQTAANAGIPCIGVTWGFRDREVLENAGAQYIIDKPEEILDLVL